MKVLWFEVSMPANFKESGNVVLGWQDSLEHIVRKCSDIELYIAFECAENCTVKCVDGVTYIPMHTSYSFLEKKKTSITWNVKSKKVIEKGIEVINEYKPDIIHVFGNEWPFGLLAQYTKVPFIIHVQGSIIPYNNAAFPPGYNEFTLLKSAGFNFRKQLGVIRKCFKDASRLKMESSIWKLVSNYMGRTEWDRALVNLLHPGAAYYHVDEALRPIFMETTKKWEYQNRNKLKLITTGCGSFWKGVDVILKTAHILKETNIHFEWNVAGYMPPELKKTVEEKEKLRFSDNFVNILGFTKPEALVDYLCDSSMYVHTAYIENSPNSICEAQILGVPVISTMVGGISSLVRNHQDGVLLPANDPWQIADAIITLSKDKERALYYSKNSMDIAKERHSPDCILMQLLECYRATLYKHSI